MALDKRNLYRLPWSMNDNPIAWLEVTDICNIHCEGCYRQHMTGHKPLEQIKEEILFFKQWRNPDNVSIAGGEPLIHPQIVDIVAFIAQNGIKPIILTNAVALTPEMLRELKRAGLAGFTIHIDSHQNRPHWQGKSEAELNELRQHYADMVAAERGLYVIFNSTVYPSTFHEIPDVVRWGQANIDRVHGLVFITYRTATTDTHVAHDVADQQVDLGKLSYVAESFDEKFVTCPEVYQIIKDNCRSTNRPATWAAASCTPLTNGWPGRSSAPRNKCTARWAKRPWKWPRRVTICSMARTWPTCRRQISARKSSCSRPGMLPCARPRAIGCGMSCGIRGSSSRASTCRASASSRRRISCRMAAPTCATVAPT